MKKLGLLIAVIAYLFVFSSPVGAQTFTKKEARALLNAYNSTFGCTKARKRISKAIIEFPDTKFAFVGRTAPKSVTGIRGCGFAWGRSQSKVNARAMGYCKKRDRRHRNRTGRTCKLLIP